MFVRATTYHAALADLSHVQTAHTAVVSELAALRAELIIERTKREAAERTVASAIAREGFLCGRINHLEVLNSVLFRKLSPGLEIPIAHYEAVSKESGESLDATATKLMDEMLAMRTESEEVVP